ncbi:MAG: 50S ribosomal protein L32 [Phycisphaerae bacterium]|nr:50S ribosomal protein L32 [Phycisphaerae bacterium]NUQ47395.1 50S ribosomal protein L32 [Phycisphaerae bacterium]
MVPPQKVSKGRKRRRRAHHALTAPNLVPCPQCQAARRPHTVCERCGYAGRKLSIPVKTEEK